MSGKTFLFACQQKIRTNNFICRALSGRPVLDMFTKVCEQGVGGTGLSEGNAMDTRDGVIPGELWGGGS